MVVLGAGKGTPGGHGEGVARATATGKKSQIVLTPRDIPATALLLSICVEPSAARPNRIAVCVVSVVTSTYAIVAAVAALAVASASLKKGPFTFALNLTDAMVTPNFSKPCVLTMLVPRSTASLIPVMPEFNSR